MSAKTATRLFKLSAAALLCALACAAMLRAQTRQTRQTGQTRPPAPARRPATTRAAATATADDAQGQQSVPEEDADLVIIANVHAKELRFDVVPNPSVEFPGRPARDTEWSAQRTNLPREVQPGVTYRDIGIRLKIVSRFRDIDRIVAEALGETPPTDDAPPAATPPPSAQLSPTQPPTPQLSTTQSPPSQSPPSRPSPSRRRAHAQRRHR